jgi:hypothetical protein
MLHLTLSEDLAVLYVSYAARFAFMAVSYVMLLARVGVLMTMFHGFCLKCN